jgi:type II secretory pathway component PulF
MHDSNDGLPQDQVNMQLRIEMQEWAFGIRCVFAVFNLLLLYYCTRILLAAPEFEHIFEDMLGSKDKLPVISRFMFKWSQPLLESLWVLAVLVTVLIFRAKRARTVWLTTVLLLVILLTTSHLALTSFVEPLGTVIENLSGGSGENPL